MIPEVVFAESKRLDQTVRALSSLYEQGGFAFATRVLPAHFWGLREALPDAVLNEDCRAVRLGKLPPTGKRVAVLTGGTSDVPTAEEAAFTLEAFGHEVSRFYDVGISGIHRLMDTIEDVRKADCLIACAGVEGGLVNVVAGLVIAPVIAVPTSVGYGVSVGGVVALFAMLAACSPGIGVVNIDNGFGAAALAHKIVR
jgi:NCAIR mutase (PurE)-related protein